ncbi:putative RNA-binding Zn-ribbon protein involved in translation (DUF1610 family) [Variovorax boronicumulans]|uniref:RNA-binding Zn-ribbon protein involved in translation (DUF1610 family) n=1 Tax=Variovorax boronicumulans TaxID=436515 RepID=A0AAW8CSD1_9BURK|nr:hypothetical protein [Variovorax boronicumulans]MDP9893215.1 putative RNA-binding Zn-ribbon protein involved in translation (DUF1610 family) [Variovorax boronicumulans]MDQ0052438.1 putative RNA-binding Zn-ribbon protein involved in translation (DUF1610 family) [Variovorax boronicumulans]
MTIIKFSCPQCGNKDFKTAKEPTRIEDFNGAVCTSCGRALKKADIEKQALKEAEKLITASLGKFRK